MEKAELSDDQREAFGHVKEVLAKAGVHFDDEPKEATKASSGKVVAIVGKAGSGKTLLLSRLVEAARNAGVDLITGEHRGGGGSGVRTLAVLAPTNRAASVLRKNGVLATTIHRIIYTPVYDPKYEGFVDWLEGKRKTRPEVDGIDPGTAEGIASVFESTKSAAAALASAGIRGSDFITDWTPRDDSLDVAFVDEASMITADQLKDLRNIFPTLVLFGDPAQLAPVNSDGEMVFAKVPEESRRVLSRIHRQDKDNPVLDLAHALSDPNFKFDDFDRMISDIARRDDRVVVSERVDSDLMPRSPVLLWRNKTRISLIQAFRNGFGFPEDKVMPGEPLICDGIELPFKFRNRRIELEVQGLSKGVFVTYISEGRRPGFARLHIHDVERPRLGVASIILLERPDGDPIMPNPAGMGARFLHGAAVTIHKSQGGQWPVVQVLRSEILAAAMSQREESGLPLWKRLAYVAITRAEERLIWVRKRSLVRPKSKEIPLDWLDDSSRLNLESVSADDQDSGGEQDSPARP